VTKDSSRMKILRDDIYQGGIYETADLYVRRATHPQAEKDNRCKMTSSGCDLGEGVSFHVCSRISIPGASCDGNYRFLSCVSVF
jgi:hypothetical protein